MCVQSCIDFTRAALTSAEVAGRRVLEVGSYDVNGSVRRVITGLAPAAYVGVDISEGPGVDVVCDVSDLVATFGPESHDVVVTTEMMEHVRDWRSAIRNLTGVLRPGGVLLLTTRSRGFKYHGYPFDFWRYELDDMRAIFAGFELERAEPDPATPGVFVKVRRPIDGPLPATELEAIQLYSIILERRADQVSDDELRTFLARTRWRRIGREWLVSTVPRVLPRPIKTALKRVLPRSLWQ